LVKEVIASNPQEVLRYKAGTEKLFGSFVGQAMAKNKGQGNPKGIHELLKKIFSLIFITCKYVVFLYYYINILDF
jgi:Asp-tRNA(Asn)/Glu-tRNA(Gln) amidotransferase B subunit